MKDGRAVRTGAGAGPRGAHVHLKHCHPRGAAVGAPERSIQPARISIAHWKLVKRWPGVEKEPRGIGMPQDVRCGDFLNGGWTCEGLAVACAPTCGTLLVLARPIPTMERSKIPGPRGRGDPPLQNSRSHRRAPNVASGSVQLPGTATTDAHGHEPACVLQGLGRDLLGQGRSAQFSPLPLSATLGAELRPSPRPAGASGSAGGT